MCSTNTAMSDSDSSYELYDADPEDIDFFDYEDPALQASQFYAVVENNVPLLTSLLESGRSVNTIDNLGRTPLHVAIEKNKREAFDFLLTVEDIRLDAIDFNSETPLMRAVGRGFEYYAFELLKKGVDADIYKNFSYGSPLHFVSNNLVLAQTLIEKGFDVNCQDGEGNTPLHVACQANQPDFAHLLLYYGADPLIENTSEFLPFTMCLSGTPELEETLFNYTFDKYTKKINLNTLSQAMKYRSRYFYELLERDFSYDYNSLYYLSENLCTFDIDMFLFFINRFTHIFCDFIAKFNPLKSLLASYTQQKLDLFFRLSETQFIENIIENYNRYPCAFDFVITKLPEDTLSQLILCLLSYGAKFSFSELSLVYKYHGFGNLFKILVHMDVSPNKNNSKHLLPTALILPKTILPNFIYNLHQDLDIFYDLDPQQLDREDFDLICNFFVHPGLVEISECFERKVPQVPSLLELSRNCTRKHIISKFGIKNSRQFFTVLRWLPICDDYKDILSFQKPIYS